MQPGQYLWLLPDFYEGWPGYLVYVIASKPSRDMITVQVLNSWGKGRRRRFGWELCWFEGGVADAAHERRTPHSHSKKDSFEPWLESASFDSFVPVACEMPHFWCLRRSTRGRQGHQGCR